MKKPDRTSGLRARKPLENPIVRLLLLLLSILLLAGCGGHIADVPGGSPVVTVNWPTRTRDFAAPASALSVKVDLHPLTNGQPDILVLGNRNTNIAAHPETYTGNMGGGNGDYTLTATFYSQANQTGGVVATATATVFIQLDGVLVRSNGLPLGTLAFTSSISAVFVNPYQSIRIGQQTQLTASAFDANGNLIALSPGSFTFLVTGSRTTLTTTPDGLARGIQVGSGMVTATVDGIVSDPAIVSIVPLNPTVTTINLASNDIAYDSTRNLLYSSTPNAISGTAGQVAVVNASSGAIGAPIATNNSPTFLAVTLDGTELYAAGSGNIVRVTLATGKIDETIQLPTGTQASQIFVLPDSDDSIAVALHSTQNVFQDAGTVIYDLTVARPSTAMIGTSIAINDAGTRIYGYARGANAPNQYSTANIGTTGITGATSSTTAIQGQLNRIYWTNGEIASDTGVILSPDTGATLGTLPLPPNQSIAVPISGNSLIYYLNVSSPNQVLTYSLTNFTQTSQFSLTNTTGSIGKGVFMGADRLAYIGGGSSNQIILVNGLAQ